VLRVDRMSAIAICVHPEGDPWSREQVAIDLVEPVRRGQMLLVYAGVALANLDQTDAALASLAVRWEASLERLGPEVGQDSPAPKGGA
jgi:hydrogenase maturation factor